jgi:hypothetical protein
MGILALVAVTFGLARCGGMSSGLSSESAPTPLVATSQPADGQTRGYFPPDAFSERPEHHQFVVDWYSKHLRVMNEPMLYASLPQNREVYRFLLLPTWGRPAAVRVQSRPSDGYRLIATVLSGSGGYDPGVIQERKERSLHEEEWRGLKRLLREADFWEQPTRLQSLGRDGEQWIIEGISGERYHVVDRWTPDSGPIHQIGSFLLNLANVRRDDFR